MTLLTLAAAATAFDPEAATQVYLATLKGAARAKSNAYFEGGYWLILWGALVSVISHWALLHTGLSARFRNWVERFTARRFLQSMLWAIPYSVVVTMIVLPWTIYTDFYREQKYGLMNQSFGAWLGEQAINLAVETVLLALIIALLFAAIRRFPRRWWLVGAGVMSAFIMFGALVAPVFIAPLFNSYTELPVGPVRDRVVEMATAQKVPVEHIYVFDQSKQHNRISANVSGLGPTIRISLNDNLLKRTTVPETAAVMGHELGHYVLNHSLKLVPALALVILLGLFVASRAIPAMIARWGQRWGVRGSDDVATFPVLVMVMSVVLLVLTPVTNTLIRVNESEADAFGLDVAREPDGFATTALALSEYRKIEPGAVEEFLFFDHPSGRTRIRMAMDWKAAHLAEVEGAKVEAGPK